MRQEGEVDAAAHAAGGPQVRLQHGDGPGGGGWFIWGLVGFDGALWVLLGLFLVLRWI